MRFSTQIYYHRVTLLKIFFVCFLLVSILSLHFLTPTDDHTYHNFHLVYDRLGYIPILIAAYWFGFWGGLFTSLGLASLHLLHIQISWEGHFFHHNLNQTLEVMMYIIIGVITGILSEKLLRTARWLSDSYDELKIKTQQVFQAEEHLRRTERIQALAELSAGIAHEIRTPLASIKGAAEIVASPHLNAEQRREFTDILTKETKHLNTVVSEFLDFARPKSQVPTECHIPSIIDSVLDLTFQQRVNHDIKVHKEYCDDLPPVFFDPAQLKQVFVNLITNAMQALEPGGQIFIRCDRDEPGSILCVVEDTGRGIPPELMQRIFNPFFTTRPQGTGLGLSIVQKILQSHHSTIKAENRPEGGARFTLRFPRIVPVKAGEE